MSNYLAEAFTQLKLLESEQFSFDKEGAAQLANFMEDDAISDFEEFVIDPEAETEEELRDSYLGMGILKCEVCKSMIYKDIENISIDEEAQLANIGECCPYCYSTDGFKIVGKVAPFEEVTVETDGDESVKVKVDGNTVTPEVEEEPEEDIQPDKHLEEALDTDAIKYQEYVDHDIKEYGKVAESTITELERVGLTLTKDNKVISKQGREDEEVDPKQKYPIEKPEAKDSNFISAKDKQPKLHVKAKDSTFISAEDKIVEKLSDKSKAIKESSELSNIEKLFRAYPELRDEEPLTESMEDISITTDDTVIKVKATPRTDKETIVPIKPEEVEAPVEEEKNEEEDMEMVNIEDIDETSFDELGESYLKKVYDNVESYKTSDALLVENKIKLEGIITFKSGKRAKTNFLFEAKEITKSGKLKFIGENVNLSKNKKAFTIIASSTNGKLITESFNYNYLGKDSITGKAQRLYGTIKK